MMKRLLKPNRLTVQIGLVLALLVSCVHSLPAGLAQSRAALGASQRGASLPLAELQRLFRMPPDDAKIMMRWWWFGPAVSKAELEREMRLMKEGGIGGFEIQPVYPLALDDAATGVKNLQYLSNEFIE